MKHIQEYKDRRFSFFWTGSIEKKVITPWRVYTERFPTKQELENWGKQRLQNWAIVTGKISNLVVVDVDTIKGGDPSPFIDRGFYTVRTQSGGYHFYFKYTPLLSKTKHKRQTTEGDFLHAIDIQSDGAIVFAPPSEFVWKDGSVHGYEYLGGEIQELPGDLLEKILAALAPEALDELDENAIKRGQLKPYEGKPRPGDIYNHYASWDEILVPLGWKKLRERGETTDWMRPGKGETGLSLTTNWKGWGLAIPFTSSVPELTPLRGYTKFSLYAHLYHGGNFTEASKEIRNRIANIN